jgi:hypothetical protein
MKTTYTTTPPPIDTGNVQVILRHTLVLEPNFGIEYFEVY